MQTASIVISIIALLISISTPLIQYNLDKKLSRRDSLSNYLRENIGSIVFTDLPAAIMKIHLDNKAVTATDDAISVLRKVRKSILFYQHVDKVFYDEYKSSIQELEDILVKTATVENDLEYCCAPLSLTYN